MAREWITGLRMMLWLTLVTGIVYPLAVTGVCQAWFPRQANGSLVEAGGRVVGSALIGQNFQGAGYFHPRPSAAGTNGYDATASGGSNLGPTSHALIDRVRQGVAAFRQANPDFHGPIPVDLLTASGSGLDPDLSPAAAEAQVARVAAARGIAATVLEALVGAHRQGKQWGFLGEPRVAVLALNLDLDRRYPMPAQQGSGKTQ